MKYFTLFLMEFGFFAGLYLLFWSVNKLKQYMILTVNQAKHDKKLRNDIYSCLYFLMDMGPNVSAYSIVAIVITTKDSFYQLLAVFMLGIALKRIGRRLANNLASLIGENKQK